MKIGILITVRLGSSRLKRKALKTIHGKPIIGYLIERIKHECADLADIILCTTTLQEDKELKSVADTYGIGIFYGDTSNIILRHYQCALNYNFTYIVNIDGDDILCNPHYVKRIINYINTHQNIEVIQTKNLPFGTNSMAYSRNVLYHILNNNEIQGDTGWSTVILDKKQFKIVELYADLDENMDDLRLTLDYPEDFLLLKILIENVVCKYEFCNQDSILKYIEKNPSLKKINQNVEHIYWENFTNKHIKVIKK